MPRPSRSAARALSAALVVVGALTPIALEAVVDPDRAASATATAGTWGPDAVPYSNGVVCRTPDATTPLVAWTVPDLNGPAFALDQVLGPATGQTGTSDEPAAGGGVQHPVSPGGDGLTAAQISAAAYLIAAHGSDLQPTAVGDVAATLASLRAPNPTAQTCLEQGGNGLDAGTAADLWASATRLAGPYTVTVTSGSRLLTLGTPATLTAVVTAASGAPVPGLTVTFRVSGGDATTGTTVQSATNAAGVASAPVTVPKGSTAPSVTVSASVSAPVGLTAEESPGRVTVVVPAAPQVFTGRLTAAVDTTANPTVTPTLTRTLLLPGAAATAGLTVTGLRGHDGTATMAVLGPLPFVPRTGCARYTEQAWKTASAGGVDVVTRSTAPVSGDGRYAPVSVTFSNPGCYTVTGTVTTSNAVPAVTRTSQYGSVGQIVTVAPITVTTAAAGHGIAVAGAPAAVLAVTGPTPATVAGATGRLVGPLQPSYSTCPRSGWASAPTAATMSGAGSSGSVTVRADSAVNAIGCYAYSLRATVHLAGIGDVPIASGPDDGGNTLLLIAASAAVVNLSDNAATTGDRVTTTVSVSGTLNLPGTLSIRLRHLPYTDLGCLDRDWTHATATPARPTDLTVPTQGDGDYAIETPPLPGSGCWAPVPVLTLNRNPAIKIVGTPPSHDMLAITGLGPPPAVIVAARAVRDRFATLRLVLAFLAAALVLAGAVAATVVWARRDDVRSNGIGATDRLLG